MPWFAQRRADEYDEHEIRPRYIPDSFSTLIVLLQKWPDLRQGQWPVLFLFSIELELLCKLWAANRF